MVKFSFKNNNLIYILTLRKLNDPSIDRKSDSEEKEPGWLLKRISENMEMISIKEKFLKNHRVNEKALRFVLSFFFKDGAYIDEWLNDRIIFIVYGELKEESDFSEFHVRSCLNILDEEGYIDYLGENYTGSIRPIPKLLSRRVIKFKTKES